MTQLAVAVVASATAARVAQPAGALCQTVPTCIARARKVAASGHGITPSEKAVARAFQALSPEAIEPLLSLLQDPDVKVSQLAGHILGDMPGLQPKHLDLLEEAVQAGDHWIPPAIGSIGTPRAIRF